MKDPTLAEYYARRVSEYEEIYAKPERQSDLHALKDHIKNLLHGHHTLEIACGTGYWTTVVGETAASVLGIDLHTSVLERAMARCRGQPHVRFQQADAYLKNITVINHLGHRIDSLYDEFDSLSGIRHRSKMAFLFHRNIENLIFRYK